MPDTVDLTLPEEIVIDRAALLRALDGLPGDDYMRRKLESCRENVEENLNRRNFTFDVPGPFIHRKSYDALKRRLAAGEGYASTVRRRSGTSQSRRPIDVSFPYELQMLQRHLVYEPLFARIAATVNLSASYWRDCVRADALARCLTGDTLSRCESRVDAELRADPDHWLRCKPMTSETRHYDRETYRVQRSFRYALEEWLRLFGGADGRSYDRALWADGLEKLLREAAEEGLKRARGQRAAAAEPWDARRYRTGAPLPPPRTPFSFRVEALDALAPAQADALLSQLAQEDRTLPTLRRETVLETLAGEKLLLLRLSGPQAHVERGLRLLPSFLPGTLCRRALLRVRAHPDVTLDDAELLSGFVMKHLSASEGVFCGVSLDAAEGDAELLLLLEG